jgi:hypothetical protein
MVFRLPVDNVMKPLAHGSVVLTDARETLLDLSAVDFHQERMIDFPGELCNIPGIK